MTIALPQGDLARVKSEEPDQSWPTMIEIVAIWKGEDGKRGRQRSIRIPADQFFGRKAYGAPMSGDQLIAMIERLRKS